MDQVDSKKARFWDERRGVIHTRKGGWVIGKGVTSHGYSLFGELLGKATYFQVMILNVTGALPERRLAQWLEAAYICLSWPDPRIWCNQIGSLGGTLRTSPVAAVCSGALAGDSSMYGPGTAVEATNFNSLALKRRKQGCSIEQIVSELRKGTEETFKLPGFARPIAKGDERVSAMQRIADLLGFAIGTHLELAYEIEEYTTQRYGESINLTGYMVAFLLDQGLSAKEIYRINSLCVSGGVHACYSEAVDNPPESFLPLRCEDIEYCGKPERRVPPG